VPVRSRLPASSDMAKQRRGLPAIACRISSVDGAAFASSASAIALNYLPRSAKSHRCRQSRSRTKRVQNRVIREALVSYLSCALTEVFCRATRMPREGGDSVDEHRCASARQWALLASTATFGSRVRESVVAQCLGQRRPDGLPLVPRSRDVVS